MNFFFPRSVVIAFAAAVGALLAGCAQAPITGARTRLEPPRAVQESENSSDPAGTGRSNIALLVGGEPIGWDILRPLLAEAAGGEVVEELALEYSLRAELRARGLTVGDSQVEAARETWLALLEDSGVSVEAEAEIRRRRGLGRERFRRLLWRNAALRALIDPADVTVSDSEIGLAKQIRTGRRYLVTGAITPAASDALLMAGAARDDAAGAAVGLWRAATAKNLTPFRTSMSLLDPAYPESVRRALPSVQIGQPSPAIAVENGFGIVVVEAVFESTPGSAINDAAMRRELSIRKTRLEMERLARRLIDRADISRLDRSLP